MPGPLGVAGLNSDWGSGVRRSYAVADSRTQPATQLDEVRLGEARFVEVGRDLDSCVLPNREDGRSNAGGFPPRCRARKTKTK